MISRRALTSAIGVVALLSASYFPMTSACAATGETAIIVPYPPGGPLDVSARALADAVKDKLGTTIVENRPGAGGNVGMSTAKRRDGDGKTLVMGAVATLAINPHLYPTLPYDPKKDFKSVTLVATAPNVVVITPAFAEKNNIKNLQDLVAYAKANPGKVDFASSGNGTTSHLAGLYFAERTGTVLQHIPYRGGAAAMLDVLSGRIPLMIDVAPNAIPHVEAGKLVPLGVTTAERLPSAPNVPTLQEAGIDGFLLSAWDGFVLPKGTPEKTVKAFNAALQAALKDEAVAKRLAARGAVVKPGTPEDFRAFIEREAPKWASLVKTIRAEKAKA